MFFKQKTAYEMLRSLVGSEMCIRDSGEAARGPHQLRRLVGGVRVLRARQGVRPAVVVEAVSYTHLTLPTIYSV